EQLAAESTGDGPRAQRLHVRVARERRIDRLESARRVEERGKGLGGPPHVDGDLSLQALRECSLALVVRSVERSSQQRRCSLRRSGELLGVRGFERTARATCR